MFHSANESYKDNLSPFRYHPQHLHICSSPVLQGKEERERSKKKKTQEGKDKGSPLILHIQKKETMRGAKTPERQMRLSETYNYPKLTSYGQ